MTPYQAHRFQPRSGSDLPPLPMPEPPTDLQLVLEDQYLQLDAWRSVARSLARELLIPDRAVQTAASSLATIALLPDVSSRYRSWMHSRVMDDLVGRPRTKSPHPNAPAKNNHRAQLRRVPLS